MKLHWDNLTWEERAEYMRMKMKPAYGGRSSYLPDDCSECPVCEQPTLGSGWCRYCLDRFIQLDDKLRGKITESK